MAGAVELLPALLKSPNTFSKVYAVLTVLCLASAAALVAYPIESMAAFFTSGCVWLGGAHTGRPQSQFRILAASRARVLWPLEKCPYCRFSSAWRRISNIPVHKKQLV